jgi:predicted ABC-type transport system involved in lysophospholipase L1 biosynthesis ATPase subunit
MNEEGGGPRVEARDVRKSYRIGAREVAVLRGVTLAAEAGEALAVLGASGAGKSTLLNVLGALDPPTGGTVRCAGRDLYAMTSRERAAWRATRVGFVFQAFHLLPELDLVDNVLLPALARRSAWRRGGVLRRRALDLIERVGLADRVGHRPDELSGGEQQRAALARALMNEPEIVLADEPTGNLDSQTGARVLDVLFALVRERGRTLIVVTHDPEVAGRCDRRLRLADGRIAE